MKKCYDTYYNVQFHNNDPAIEFKFNKKEINKVKQSQVNHAWLLIFTVQLTGELMATGGDRKGWRSCLRKLLLSVKYTSATPPQMAWTRDSWRKPSCLQVTRQSSFTTWVMRLRQWTTHMEMQSLTATHQRTAPSVLRSLKGNILYVHT